MGSYCAAVQCSRNMKRNGTLRRRYYVLVSVIYILIGLVIMVRSVLAHVAVIAILGIVFIALGAVRLRDYLTWTGEVPQ
jgi:uncharacterized membrane protein HdeD (DUF308 family)